MGVAVSVLRWLNIVLHLFNVGCAHICFYPLSSLDFMPEPWAEDEIDTWTKGELIIYFEATRAPSKIFHLTC